MKRLFLKHQRKINYLLVGGWNTLFGYGVFVALYVLFRAQVHYMLIWLATTVLSITNAYLGYKTFVFKTRGNYLKEYFRFYAVYSGGMALSLIFLPIGVEWLKLSPPIAQGGLMFLNVGFSYFGHKHFSFR